LVRRRENRLRSTWLDYKRSVDSQLIPAFGNLHLSELTRAKLREWASGLDVRVLDRCSDERALCAALVGCRLAACIGACAASTRAR